MRSRDPVSTTTSSRSIGSQQIRRYKQNEWWGGGGGDAREMIVLGDKYAFIAFHAHKRVQVGRQM